ncbi:hypothetical protein [Acetobacterium sp. KB-1]|jgi:hypothetical protein|uniref:hypothetical protein n=1 Tax=Acetobacterium sp. KB-1 TaxID=2184575 RepID=UPI000DBEC5D8|nr:hypothetical protein [Acetobacterium sp. KB-1]AWW27701.1 hypothetical protein DOZ58_14280 [Acetobacterium sp. KB-1]
MDLFKRHKRNIIIGFSLVVIIIIISNILYQKGFRIVYDSKLGIDWVATGTIAQYIAAIASLLIPIVVLFLQHTLEKNRIAVGDSNRELLEEVNKYFDKIKILTELVNENGEIIIDGGAFETIEEDSLLYKEKTLKYINVAMIAETKNVAEYLGLNIEKTFEILKDLVAEKSISVAGRMTIDNVENIVWKKK